jgi:anaerobic ribonucleoside-triphosphate reductase activating protein
MNICGFLPESLNEGDGLRAVLFFSGCKHNCPGCFSPETHDFNYGKLFDEEEENKIIGEIINNPLLDGITICGGDPFFSAKEVILFIEKIKKILPKLNVWIYSGFTYEEILKNEEMRKLLSLCDVLIDGRFIKEQEDLTLKFRGSRNQRIIDIKNSTIENIILLD